MEKIIFEGAIVIIAIMAIIALGIRIKQHTSGIRSVDESEVVFNFFKFFGYLGGAIMIYKVFSVNSINNNMDVISCYAFLLCLLETVHTFVNSIVEILLGLIFSGKKRNK